MEFKSSKYIEDIYEFVKYGYGNAVISAVAGSGKCLGVDTEILMYDCSIKKVQDIVVGDKLMGDDSSPRTVLSTNIGFGELRKITPKKGIPWICNDIHILSLQKYNKSKKNKKSYYSKEDICIKDIETESKLKSILHSDGYLRPYKLYRVPLNFKMVDLKIDPWLYGVWLGDGTTKKSEITNNNEEVINEIKKRIPDGSFTKLKFYNNKCPIISINGIKNKNNPFRQFIRSSLINNEKSIKKDYLYNSRENRLKLLAGLIDSDGYISKSSCEIAVKFDNLAKDILFLCRSLGFAAYDNYKTKKCYNNGKVGKYHIISISGDLSIIPVIIKYKIPPKRKINKDVLRVGFKIEKIENNYYYGFTIDGNGRFLLGDLTVTHNTSTIVKSIDYIKPERRVLFLAFNNSIVEELNKRITRENTDIKTLHSLGFSIIKYNFKDKNIKIDENKYKLRLKFLLEEYGMETIPNKSYIKHILKLCDLCRFYLIKSKKELEVIANKYTIISSYDNDNVFNEINITLELLEWAKDSLNETETIDYTDMLYLPNILNLKTFKYDFIIIDEAQDLSVSKMSLFMKCFKQGTRFIAVGDEKQTINGFAGSDIESFNKLKNLKNTMELPLSICYRCPKNIVRLAQTIVPNIEYREDAPDGYINYNAKLEDLIDGDMVICRTSLPLIKLYFKLMSINITSYIKGIDIGINLLDLIENIQGNTIKDILNQLNELKIKYINNNINIGMTLEDINSGQEYNDFIDKIDCIKILSNGINTKDELISRVKDMFSDENKQGICLSTIHKAKGLEADNVYILDKKLMPSKFAKQEWEKIQEQNLIYVAYTRAKKVLGFINS